MCFFFKLFAIQIKSLVPNVGHIRRFKPLSLTECKLLALLLILCQTQKLIIILDQCYSTLSKIVGSSNSTRDLP